MINTPKVIVSRAEKYYITTKSETITFYTVPVRYIYFLQQYKQRRT